MTTSTQTRPLTTEARVTAVTAPATTDGVRAGRLSTLRAAVRTRRAQRSELSRQIAAYPATRGAGVTVLPSGHRIAGSTDRF
jgi:hypothetical protein